MFNFAKQIAEENNLKVPDVVLKRVALILENRQDFFFDREGEGLSPWVSNIVTLINTCNQDCVALYIQENKMYPSTNVTGAIDGATDWMRQEGTPTKVYKVDEEGYSWFATATPEGTVYSN